jgi:hypothetical protein
MSLLLLPGRELLAPIRQESGWAPELAWNLWHTEKSLPCWESIPTQPVTILHYSSSHREKLKKKKLKPAEVS